MVPAGHEATRNAEIAMNALDTAKCDADQLDGTEECRVHQS